MKQELAKEKRRLDNQPTTPRQVASPPSTRPYLSEAHAGVGNAVLANQSAPLSHAHASTESYRLQSELGNAAMQREDLSGEVEHQPGAMLEPGATSSALMAPTDGQRSEFLPSFFFPTEYAPVTPQLNGAPVASPSAESADLMAPYVTDATLASLGILPIFNLAASEPLISPYPQIPKTTPTESVTTIVFEEEEIIAGGARVKEDEVKKKREERVGEAETPKEQVNEAKAKKEQAEKEAKPDETKAVDLKLEAKKKEEAGTTLTTTAAPGAKEQVESAPAEGDHKKTKEAPATGVISAEPKAIEGEEVRAVEKTAAVSGGAGDAGPELAQWEGKISKATKAIQTTGPEAAGATGAHGVRREARQARGRASVARKKIDKEAEKIVEPPPPIPDPLLPPEQDAVPKATDLVRSVSDLKLPNQTMPPLQMTPGKIMPKPPQGVSAEHATKVATASEMEFEEQAKLASASGNKKEIARIKKARKAREKKFRADWAEGKAEPLVLVEEPPPPPVPMSKQTQTDIGKVLATLTLMQEDAAQEIVADARREASRANAPTGEPVMLHRVFNFFGDKVLPGVRAQLGKKILDIGAAARLTKDDLDRHVAERKTELMERAVQTLGKLSGVAELEKFKLKTDWQQNANKVEGASKAVDNHAGTLAKDISLGSNPEIIRQKREQLVIAISRKTAQLSIGYIKAGERRAKALTDAGNAMIESYKAAALLEQANYLKAAKKARKDEATAKAEATTLSEPTFVWLQGELIPNINDAVGKMKTTAMEVASGYDAKVKGARVSALDMIADWAESLIVVQEGFWEENTRQVHDWEIAARESAATWEAAQTSDARDSLVRELDTLRNFTDLQAGKIDAQQAFGGKQLTEQQGSVINDFYQEGPGKGDAILTVAQRLKARISAERRPELVKTFEAELWKLGPPQWDLVDLVAMAEFPTGKGAEWIASEVRDATDRIGTEEPQIYTALANMTPLLTQAARLYYRNRGWGDLDEELKDELSGAEYKRAKALMDRDQGMAGAAAIRYAILPGMRGGDVSTVMQVLKSTPAADLRAKFKQEYDIDLDTYLKQALTGADLERAQALLAGEKTTAYAVELKKAVAGKDRKGVEGVYAQIRADVEGEAAEKSAKVRAGTAPKGEREWNTKKIEDEVANRIKAVETIYEQRAAREDKDHKDLRDDLNKKFSGAALNLVVALHERDPIAANAARLKLQDKATTIYTMSGPIVITGDAKAINGLLATQADRARMEVERDLNIDLRERREAFSRKQEIAFLRGWKPEEVKAAVGTWDEKGERENLKVKVEEETQKRAQDYTAQLKSHYDKTYAESGGLDAMLDRNVTGQNRQKAKDLINQGGILKPEQVFHYAVADKDADAVKSFLGSKSKDEMTKVKADWEKSPEGQSWKLLYGDKAFDKYATYQFDGRDLNDIKVDLPGAPANPREMLERKKQKLDYERTAYGLAAGRSPEQLKQLKQMYPNFEESSTDIDLRNMESDYAKLEEEVKYLESLPEGSEAHRVATVRYQRLTAHVDQSVENYRKAIDRETDQMAMIAGIVATALVIVLTAGAAAPLVALAAAAAGAAATIGTKWLMKRDAYTHDEMMTDIVVGAVDALASAVTAGIGGKLIKALGPLAKMAKSPQLAPRLLAHGLAEGAENFIATIPSSVAAQLMDKRSQGLDFSGIFSAAALGAGLGGVMGSVGGFKRPLAKAAASESADLLASRGTAAERQIAWQSFQKTNPGKTYKDFLTDLDAGIVARQADEEAVRQAQRRMRGELFRDIPPAQRGQFKDVPIEIMSDADFARFTRSDLGDAVVIVVDGKPRVLLRETADIKVLRREGKHLLQSVDPETAHLFRMLDEKKLAKWDRLSFDEQLSLYKNKVDLEIDAQQRTLRDLQGDLTAAGADPAARKRVLGEMDEVQHTLDNLNKRAGEVGSITPQQRRAMRQDKSLRPDYLDQPARLFEKRSRLTIKRELVASMKLKGLDTAKANRVLEKLRVAAEGAGPKRPFASVVKKMETLLATDPKAAKAYLDDLNSTIDNWIGDPRGGLAIIEASTKMKDSRAFLGAANKLTSIVEKGAKGKASETLDAIAGKVSRLEPAAAHKYLNELSDVLDSFSPKKPSELIGFLRATASMDNSTSFTNKLKTFAANRKRTGVDLPEQTMKEIGDAMAALPPRKAAKFVDALDDFTRSHTPDELRRFDGFIVGAARAKSGDPVKYLADVKDLIKQKEHGLSAEALDVLAAKVGRRTLDVEWLVRTNIYKEKAAREFFDLAAKDINTPWNLYRAADRHPDVKFLQDRLRRPVRGLAGEYLTFLLGKELKEAGEILQDAAARKTMNTLKRAGIEEVTGAQIEVITEKFGRSVIDVPVRSKLGPHGLEVKAYGATYWEQILDAWEVKALNPYAVLDQAQGQAFFSMHRMLKQLNNADEHFKNPPFLLTSTTVDNISPRHRDILDDIIANEMPPGTKILTLPESDFEWAEKELKRLFSSK